MVANLDTPISLFQRRLMPSLPKTELQMVWDRIIGFQKAVYGVLWPKDRDELSRHYAVCMAKEAFEILDETNFKAHKRSKALDPEAIRAEHVDVFIYDVASAAMWFDSADDFMEAVRRKMDINEARLKSQVNVASE